METRALTTRKGRRATYAAGLLVALLAALLGAWFVAGWHDVRQRQNELRQAPRLAADQRAIEIARDLRADLDALIAREGNRPYFHYQNLMHDPRASAGLNVSPSPLARGSEDTLVLGYFQLDDKGRATTPTINDELPALSEHEHLAKNVAFRQDVARDLSHPLTPPAPPPTPRAQTLPATKGQQVLELDRSTYAQNARSNSVYSQQPQALANIPVTVTITISPLEWRTMSFAGAPSLIAVRDVQTPDRTLAQGFVVDRSMLKAWLGAKAAGMAAELRPDDGRGAAVVAGWGLTVNPTAEMTAHAAEEASAVQRSFVIRFVGIGLIAALAAACILLLVVRAEALAHERGRFAAAAAHELRTPLAGLQLYGDLLAEGLGDPAKARDYARRMSEEASRLGRVVSNVLGFSELEFGNLGVDARVGPLGEALRELAERAEPALTRAGASLVVDVASDLRARFDRDALARIVGNLLDNAEKYARTENDRSIRLSAIDRGDVVEVSVEDHGTGVVDKTKLFRAFSRGVSGSNNPAGLGLGLALSMSLARAMGGALRYAPRDGGGAAFILQLPRA